MNKIKNVKAIREEAKQEIKEILKEMKCYTFSDEGIDTWLDNWERAKEDDIVSIAEKSPHYDGKCRILLTERFSRDTDVTAINMFRIWLNGMASRNLKEVDYKGFTYNDASVIRNAATYANKAKFLLDGLASASEKVGTLYTKLKEVTNIINDCDIFYKTEDVLDYFDYGSDCVKINGTYYNRDEFRSFGCEQASMLATMLGYNSNINQFLTSNTARDFKYSFSDIRFAKGQKLSRAVNAIAKKYGFTKDPEWEKEFAKFADAVNPLEVDKWTVLSWHPVDYLTFCLGKNWSSCSTIDKLNVRGEHISKSYSHITDYVGNGDYAFRGESASACLSYMFDSSTFIYYTVDGKYDGKNHEMLPKETRVVFSLSEDKNTLIQSRLYPQCNDDSPTVAENYKNVREIVQRAICEATNEPNLWLVRHGASACSDVGYKADGATHYQDFNDNRNKHCSVSWKNTEYPTRIMIGARPICPNCGEVHYNVHHLNCDDCIPSRY